ncbi:MAG: hypothetical protein MZU95_07570 [Desulfomicrobium escambiense]|nr:hypothetical protein [Desulfomicrobium escambiense]
MLGIWVAMALLSGLVLHVMLAEEKRENRAGPFLPVLVGLNLGLLGVNAWGLFSTTSRQSLLGFPCRGFHPSRSPDPGRGGKAFTEGPCPSPSSWCFSPWGRPTTST